MLVEYFFLACAAVATLANRIAMPSTAANNLNLILIPLFLDRETATRCSILYRSPCDC
jgi:hypothetical protein